MSRHLSRSRPVISSPSSHTTHDHDQSRFPTSPHGVPTRGHASLYEKMSAGSWQASELFHADVTDLADIQERFDHVLCLVGRRNGRDYPRTNGDGGNLGTGADCRSSHPILAPRMPGWLQRTTCAGTLIAGVRPNTPSSTAVSDSCRRKGRPYFCPAHVSNFMESSGCSSARKECSHLVHGQTITQHAAAALTVPAWSCPITAWSQCLEIRHPLVAESAIERYLHFESHGGSHVPDSTTWPGHPTCCGSSPVSVARW